MKKLYPNLLLILSVAIFGLLPPTAAHASPDSVVQNPIYSDGRTQDASQVKVLYKNNTLTISGFSGVATVEVHDFLGKKIADYQDISIQGIFNRNITLTKNSIFIISIKTASFNKSFKVVSI